MTAAATEAPAKAAKPDVLDSKDNKLELNIRVKVLTDLDAEGTPKLGTVTGLEYQRGRAVIKLDDAEKLIVRPASKLWVKKNKSGKVEFDTARAERAVKAGKKTAE